MKKILSMMMVVLMPLWVIAGCGYSGGGSDGGNGDGNGNDGNGGDGKCTPHADTMCAEGVTYWMDSCGSIEEVKEMCGCGCNAGGTDCETCTDLPCQSNSDCPSGWACDLGTNKCKQQECTSNSDCPTGFYCDLVENVCKRDTCEPSCAGKCCGNDGCGGTCPNACVPGEVCDLGNCQCRPDVTCTSNEDCPQGYYCDHVTGDCVCIPQCEGKCCGSDGCGSTCPDSCPGYCDNITCQCESPCYSNSDCPEMHCCMDGTCYAADCGTKICGFDTVCEMSCGTCPAGYTCEYQTGMCIPDMPGALCPTGQACMVMSDNGIMGCLIPPDTIPPGNQTDCGAEGCSGNFMCYCNDAECVSTICIQNCGTCPTGSECCLLTDSGIYGCLPTGCGSLPANPPSCDDNIPCQGNAGCFYDGSSYICIDLCTAE